MASTVQRPPGRPRNARAHAAILAATHRLLETGTVRRLTIEAVAREAGVGKPTIYRWWPSKGALVLDAFLAVAPLPAPLPAAASAGEALQQQLALVSGLLRGRRGRLLAEIIGEAQADPELLEGFRARFLAVWRVAAREIVERGKMTGEFDRNLDIELALDLLYGPVCYRLLVGHLPLDHGFVEALPKLVSRALAQGGSGPNPAHANFINSGERRQPSLPANRLEHLPRTGSRLRPSRGGSRS
jgi:AcrR family transcriptional regulator